MADGERTNFLYVNIGMVTCERHRAPVGPSERRQLILRSRILRFPEVPSVHIALVDRRGESPLGAGEPATIVAPAIANAVFAATGARLREVPFTSARLKHALAG